VRTNLQRIKKSDLVNQTFVKGSFTSVLSRIPLYSEGIGFIMPAVVFFVISCFLGENPTVTVVKKKAA
jgi:branched-subunit amino acid permease